VSGAESPQRDANLAVLRAYFDAMASGGPPAAMQYYHDEVVIEVPGEHPAAGRYEGLEGVAAFGAAMREASAGTFRLQPVDLLASEDHAVTIAKAHVERDGRVLDWERVIVCRVRDGKLWHLRMYESDQRAVDTALGGSTGT
jgi:ketosteroid isomerase-like protein